MSVLKHHLLIEKARASFAAGDFVRTETVCHQILEQDKRNATALRWLGLSAHHRGDPKTAKSYLSKCLAIQPRSPALLCDLARIHSTLGEFPKSITNFKKALKHDSANVQAIAGLADVYERSGDREQAWAMLRPYLDAGTEEEGMAVVLCRLLDREGETDQAIELAEKHVVRADADPLARQLLQRHLGRMYDRVGRYEEAFAMFQQAARFGAGTFNRETYESRIDDLIAYFSAENLSVLPRATNRSQRPIFIACMPRSGSTLVEQIIHAHPQAFGAGEITDLSNIVEHLQERIGSIQSYPACIADLTSEKLDALADEYLRAVKKLGGSAERVTNKNLFNYRLLGMIALLFPASRIIHIQRDPLENCLACYMAALSPALFPWLADQEQTAFVWREYLRLMDHWREVLDIPVLDVRYEELVEDTENQIRRIIEFCGLPWDDRCLQFWQAKRDVTTLSYDQVNKPIFKTALKRTDRYAPYLGTLKAALTDD